MPEDIKAAIASKLLDSLPTLLVVLGVGLFVLGLSQGYKDVLPIKGNARIVAGLAGVVLIGIGVFKSSRTDAILNPDKYGIKITSPQPGEHVNQVTVTGSIKKPLPKDYTLKVLRFFPNKAYVPAADAIISIDKGSWEASGCAIGGKPGDTRYLTAHIVGPGSSKLFDYFRIASSLHNSMRERLIKLTNNHEDYLPPIQGEMPDMFECDRVRVFRS